MDEKYETEEKQPVVAFDTVTGEEGFNLLFGKDNLIDCLWNYAIKRRLCLNFQVDAIMRILQ